MTPTSQTQSQASTPVLAEQLIAYQREQPHSYVTVSPPVISYTAASPPFVQQASCLETGDRQERPVEASVVQHDFVTAAEAGPTYRSATIPAHCIYQPQAGHLQPRQHPSLTLASQLACSVESHPCPQHTSSIEGPPATSSMGSVDAQRMSTEGCGTGRETGHLQSSRKQRCTVAVRYCAIAIAVQLLALAVYFSLQTRSGV
eukprot:92779-Amphidinium_carterae.1